MKKNTFDLKIKINFKKFGKTIEKKTAAAKNKKRDFFFKFSIFKEIQNSKNNHRYCIKIF